MHLLGEHQRLLMRRESRIVLGPRAVNLWLLVIVLTATFFAIAFSAGSMDYLDVKMNDPWTNWVNIHRDASLEKIGQLRTALADSVVHNGDTTAVSDIYHFDAVQTEIEASMDMIAVNGNKPLFRSLYYEDLSSDLIASILSTSNVIDGAAIPHDSIAPTSLGLIITMKTLEHMGYTRDALPCYVSCAVKAVGADTLGFELSRDSYMRAPLPVLAVVRRLPMNMDLVASKYFYEQYHDDMDEKPFNMTLDDSYARELRFFVPSSVTDFESVAMSLIPDTLRTSPWVGLSEDEVQARLRTWCPGNIWKVDVGDGATPLAVVKAVEQAILRHYDGAGVERIISYRESKKEAIMANMASVGGTRWQRASTNDDVISVHFLRLDSIRPFEKFVWDTAELEIEMTQVQSKENFSAVSVMGTILSAAMIVFSITCIIIFIANMLQSYFQKVRRNLGTFKAFGISTSELMRVYTIIIICIVTGALAIALALTWGTEGTLQLLGCLKDGEYSWLHLWNIRTFVAIAIILVATVVTVVVVLRRLLRQTPGDLIYDR